MDVTLRDIAEYHERIAGVERDSDFATFHLAAARVLRQMSRQSWSVSVERNGDRILTIADRELAGKDLTSEDGETIRMAARHLLAFIGEPASDPARLTDSEQGKATGSASHSSTHTG